MKTVSNIHYDQNSSGKQTKSDVTPSQSLALLKLVHVKLCQVEKIQSNMM